MDKEKKARSSEKRKSFKCSNCSSTFPSITALKKHVATEHEARKAFPCQNCTKSFRNEECLISHRTLHRDEKNTYFPCEMCDSAFKTYKGLLAHERNVHPESLVCEICEEGCKTLKQLGSHVSDVHDEESEYNSRILAFKCDVCHLYFKSKTVMQNHFRKKHAPISIEEIGVPSPPVEKSSFLSPIKDTKLPQTTQTTTSQSPQNNLKSHWQKVSLEIRVCGLCKLQFPLDYYKTHLRPINKCCRENVQCALCTYKILSTFCEYFIHYLSSHSKKDRPLLKCAKCPMTYIDAILTKVLIHSPIGKSTAKESTVLQIKDETALNATQQNSTHRLDGEKLKIEVVEIDLTLDDE